MIILDICNLFRFDAIRRVFIVNISYEQGVTDIAKTDSYKYRNYSLAFLFLFACIQKKRTTNKCNSLFYLPILIGYILLIKVCSVAFYFHYLRGVLFVAGL
ncbi:hypothetical protein M2459_001718 [Parabacteroides sp. PF5-5]|nr:hypothetical protein [Parabacteroides sp. PH5-39]MDH6315934.1 hypothetical protein [Parabacteroides sp. PF5-13]MDH6319591.1 hypothetical protein [Parabacteroides sp. PH5-13]MDH6323322.1 hypothetical protein [Parabacteroides sp. PH5-8]MDH6327170.1 hypothetical protein [Parabacteroides sp. PH5-41]MDH6334972.1 hypothetical protein [Parabacteroides sp. PF5-5]MDH6346036.1 hypothetical protein [Parabacteroides sp. PH5-46]MDH6360947.1 hypothetical protein [Parabacteroides sp. PH5-16]MDH6376614.